MKKPPAPMRAGRKTTPREDSMIDLTRRAMLAGAAATAAAPLATTFARAAAPTSGAQAPSFYRYKVGSFECTSIADGARTFPMPDGFVKNVPKTRRSPPPKQPTCRRAW